jgi:hypothetical protein
VATGFFSSGNARVTVTLPSAAPSLDTTHPRPLTPQGGGSGETPWSGFDGGADLLAIVAVGDTLDNQGARVKGVDPDWLAPQSPLRLG